MTGSPMTREEAIAWYKAIPTTGSGPERMKYKEDFPIGSIAEGRWNEPYFTLGIEYGMMIAIVEIFALTPEDFKG